MALRGAGGDPCRDDDAYFVGGKRRVSCGEGSDCNTEWIQLYKRPKHAGFTSLPPPPTCVLAQPSTPVEAVPPPAREVAFFVRPCQPNPAPPHSGYFDTDREDLELYDPDPEPETGPELELEPVFDYAVEYNGLPNPLAPSGAISGGGGFAMERTASGLSISSGVTHASSSTYDQEDLGLLGDLEAAQVVRDHLATFARRSRKNSRHERVLRTLINPKNRVAEFPIDEAALESIFSAANAIFFASRLSNRVTWDWSHDSAPQYQDSVIGTTALRRCKELNGFETLIVLSRPILMSKNFSRRLLISTFLHELIHSYLFVSCGFKAKESGGHTEGFHQIAAMIDCWAGPEHLRLREMEADLESYRAEQEPIGERYAYLQRHGSPCSQEQVQRETPPSSSESEGRAARPFPRLDDAHIPILRDQPHRLLRSLSQTSLRRRQFNDQSQKRTQYHSPYGHLESRFRHNRRDDSWEGWVDDTLDRGRASQAKSTVPILVPVSVPATMPIRVSAESGGGLEEGGLYLGYNA